jgi:hypothetical protein
MDEQRAARPRGAPSRRVIKGGGVRWRKHTSGRALDSSNITLLRWRMLAGARRHQSRLRGRRQSSARGFSPSSKASERLTSSAPRAAGSSAAELGGQAGTVTREGGGALRHAMPQERWPKEGSWGFATCTHA